MVGNAAAANFVATVCLGLLSAQDNCSDATGINYFVPNLLSGVTNRDGVFDSVVYYAVPIATLNLAVPGIPSNLLPHSNFFPGAPINVTLSGSFPNLVNTFLAYEVDALYRSILGWPQADQNAIDYWVGQLAHGDRSLVDMLGVLCSELYGPHSGCNQAIAPRLLTSGVLQPFPAPVSTTIQCAAGMLDMVDWMSMDQTPLDKGPSSLSTTLINASDNPLWSVLTAPGYTAATIAQAATRNLIWNIKSNTSGDTWDIYWYDHANVYSWITDYAPPASEGYTASSAGYSAPLSAAQWPMFSRCANTGLPGSTMVRTSAATNYKVTLGWTAGGAGLSGQGATTCQPDTAFMAQNGNSDHLNLGYEFYQVWGPFPGIFPQPAFVAPGTQSYLPSPVPTVAVVHAYGCSPLYQNCERYEESYYVQAYGLVEWSQYNRIGSVPGGLPQYQQALWQLYNARLNGLSYNSSFRIQPKFVCSWPQ